MAVKYYKVNPDTSLITHVGVGPYGRGDVFTDEGEWVAGQLPRWIRLGAVVPATKDEYDVYQDSLDPFVTSNPHITSGQPGGTPLAPQVVRDSNAIVADTTPPALGGPPIAVQQQTQIDALQAQVDQLNAAIAAQTAALSPTDSGKKKGKAADSAVESGPADPNSPEALAAAGAVVEQQQASQIPGQPQG